MKIYEYRIIVPISLARYAIGNRYMTLEYVKSETKNGEGIEIVKNEEFDGTNTGNTGITGKKELHSYKIYHLKSKIPAFVRWAVPDKYLHFHENSYNCFPHFLTTYQVPGMGKDFQLQIESQHVEFSCSNNLLANFPKNATNLSEADLKKRKVIWLDILNGIPKNSEFNLKDFKCDAAGLDFTSSEFSSKFEDNSSQVDENVDEDSTEGNGIESKPPEWTKNYKGEMVCAIKVVKFQFKWFGLQTAVEKQVTHTVYPKMFTEAHRRLIYTMNDWYDLTLDDIQRLETNAMNEQRETQNFDQE